MLRQGSRHRPRRPAGLRGAFAPLWLCLGTLSAPAAAAETEPRRSNPATPPPGLLLLVGRVRERWSLGRRQQLLERDRRGVDLCGC